MNDKEKNKIEILIKDLKQSPLFAISLSGKELFHSNFWAWLIEEKDNKNKNPYIEVFIENFYKDGYKFCSVEREKNNIDLTIKCKDKNDQEIIYIVENKIKSIPEYTQLEKYTSKVGKNFAKGILTGLKPTLDLGTVEGWEFLSYEDIAKRILSISNLNREMENSLYVTQYASDIGNLSQLINTQLANSNDTYVFAEPALEQIRFADVFLKLKGVDFTEFINKELSNMDDFKAIGDWEKPKAEFSFNHKSPTITIVYRETNHSSETEEEYGRLGVQIEGKQFRIYGGGSSPGIHKENEVLSKLRAVHYITESNKEFKKELKKNGLTTGMKNANCQYGRQSAKYFHAYQWWRIEKTEYDLLLKAIIAQLRIAREKILAGFTFKETE